MKNLFVLLILFCSISVFGQKHFVGVKGGVGLTNKKGDLFQGSQNKIGFSGGLTYDYRLNDRFFLGVDVLYTQKGFKYPIVFEDEDLIVEAKSRFEYQYISLPLKVGVVFENKITGFFNIGIVPSYIVSAKLLLTEIDGKSSDSSSSHTKDVNQIDLGALIEIGGAYSLNDSLSLVSTFGYQHSLNSLTSENYFKDKSIKHYGVAFSIGCRYALGS